MKIIYLFLISSVFSKLNEITEVPCGEEICNGRGSECEDGHCVCDGDYITTGRTSVKCDYKKISRFKSGLLELFIEFGSGHFYASRNLNGKVKFTFNFLCLVCIGVSLFYIKKIRDEFEAVDHPYVSVFVLGTIAFIIVMVLWSLFDCLLFWFGVYSDGNGYEMG